MCGMSAQLQGSPATQAQEGVAAPAQHPLRTALPAWSRPKGYRKWNCISLALGCQSSASTGPDTPRRPGQGQVRAQPHSASQKVPQIQVNGQVPLSRLAFVGFPSVDKGRATAKPTRGSPFLTGFLLPLLSCQLGSETPGRPRGGRRMGLLIDGLCESQPHSPTASESCTELGGVGRDLGSDRDKSGARMCSRLIECVCACVV